MAKQLLVKFLLFLGPFVLAFSAFILAQKSTFAATGILKQINFQGKVVNANGTNVTNGNYDFVFNIYTVATGGTAIWTESRTAANQVTVTDGIFRVSLGSITALPGSIDFNTDNIYLGINFNGDGEMTPRVQFTAVPQAFNALKVAGLTVTDTTGTFTLAAAKTLTVNNTLTFAGTDATTITFQGTDTYVGRATTDTLTNKTIGSTGLTFSGATTDITTATGEDLTLVANGAGVLKLADFTTANGVLYASATDGTVSQTAASTGAQCLQTTGAGLAPVWGGCGTGTGISTVRESDLTPSVSSLTTLEFGPATTSEDEFVVTDQTGGVARVVLGTKVVKTDATQTLTNKTIGSTGLTFSGATTDIDTAASEGLTLQGRAASAFNTTTGNISFQAAGTGTTATVQIGTGGAGSTTPDYFALDIKSDTGDPAGGFEGAMYYNTVDNKFRCFQGAAWTDCIGAGGGGGGVQFATGTPDNTTTSNNLIHLQKSGVNKFIVANNGGLTINGADNSIVRSTTTEFATGTVGSNLTNANDQLEMSDGTVPNSGNGTITTASQPITSAAIGAGAHAITRSDGSYLVIRGGGTGMDVYDSVAGTFTNSAQVLNAAAGAGAISLPRPEGRYRVIHGGGLLTTSLVDPRGTVAVGASVAVVTKSAGTVAFRRPDGRFLLTNAPSVATTEIYNPVADTFAAGPSATAGVWAAGALVLPRPDGQALIVQGGATATTQLYNPSSGTGDIGVFAAGPVLPTGCEINGAGSIAIRKPDGKYIVMSKINASAIYDPVANTWSQNNSSCTTPTAGRGPTVALADGAHAMPLQNGKFLILIGGSSTVANIYDPSTDTFTAHGTAVTGGGAGRHSIMKADGTWQLINGGGTGTNNFDTGLPMSGTTTKYTSDDISTTNLNSSSTLRWTAALEAAYVGRNAATNTAFSPIQFFVRTAVNSGGCTTPLNSAVDREIQNSGDLIRPGSSDNCIRITVQMNRPIPKQIFNDMGIWIGNGKTATRRDYTTPTLFDLVVDNSTALHRNNFEFTEPNAGSAAPQNETSGPVYTRAEAQSDRLYLPLGRIAPLTQVGTTGFYMGVVGANHPNLTQAQTNDGTIVIARPNKTFKIIASLTTPAINSVIYDPATTTFGAAQSGTNAPTAANGVGGFALKRPDGKFLVVLGNASTTTNIYDPDTDTFAAGPALIAAAGVGASAIPNVDGSFTIVHGAAATTSSLYDPVRNVMRAGPTLTTASNCGFWAVPLVNSNGRVGSQYKVFPGVAIGAIGVTTAMNYDAISKTFTAGTALTSTHGCGSFAFQRQDGYWLTVSAAAGTAGAIATTTNLLNPYNGTTLAGPALSVGAGRGSHVILRSDGTFLIIHAGATPATTTTVYFPWGSTFGIGAGIGTAAAGPALATTTGTGALSFQRPDGKWVIITGNASATTNIYDAGWYADGEYRSEQMQVPALAANSTIEWKQTPDNFIRMEVRAASTQAALGTTAYQTIGRPGESIKNAGGETWVQVQVNFRRDLPTFGGSLNGVYRTGGGMVYPYREVSIPTLFEYKINNGMDLLNLQANGLSMLRVTSNGNIYSGQNGSFLSGGADLAENYTSTDSLEKGEVVVMDKSGNHGIKRSQGQYQNDILGIVSTAPGFVAGAQTEDSYPIALVGRVPVKISTENGTIRAGDFLTSASIPGFAMKATKAGRILGKALEDLQDAKTCPAFGMGNLATTKCGEIMMFVNLTDYMGAPVEVVMADQKTQNIGLSDQSISGSENQNSGFSGIADNLIVSGAPSSSEFSGISTKQQQILAFLKELRESQDQGVTSEVFTDRVSATREVISPKVITDLLYAKKIKADSIEGLEILTNRISSLGKQMAGIVTDSATLTASSSAQTINNGGDPQSSTINFQSSTVNVLNLNANGGLVVLGPSEFKGESLFDKLATFISDVIFKDDVTFLGRPTFNSDTAGLALIKKDADRVEVTFEKEYSDLPIVGAYMVFDDIKLPDGTFDQTASQEREKRISEQGFAYFVSNRTTKGFSIVLSKKATEDISFSWTAFAVKDAKTFQSKPSITPPQEASPSASSEL